MPMFQVSTFNQLSAFYICLILFLFQVLFFWLGYLVRLYVAKKAGIEKEKHTGALEGSLLGLLALILAFTFGMSSARHDKRMNVIVEEANNIGTAILRADLYPDSVRNAFRKDFKDYVENRITFFEVGADIKKVEAALKETERIQAIIWKRAAMYGRDRDHYHQSSQMIPAINAMIDITTTRNAVNIDKVPNLIIILLMLICISATFMVGYTSKNKPDWVVMLSFFLMISFTVFLIIDLDRPRRGFITLNSANTHIIKLREMFNEDK